MENQNNNNLSETLNINDCLVYYRRNDYQNGNNNFCQRCQSNDNYSKITSIYSAQKTLIISLNLKKELCQNQIKINFEECLNLSNYIIKAINHSIYDLKGIVTCDLQTGQYIVYCKNPINKQWLNI